MTKKELEERLINFSVMNLEIIQLLPDTKISNHLAGQLLRSSTSSTLNYGEAQSGESKKDFIHKLQIVVKELRESSICIRIINRSILFNKNSNAEKIIRECDELISIFVKSIETARKNPSRNRIGDL
jgi:four helix bundle protein